MATIDTDMLKKVKEPVETARGLPNEFYTDPDVFAAEQRMLFANTWACIGFGKDVAGKGAAKPVEFLGQPLVIVRDQDMQVRVFQNVCRHRGMILVDEPTTLRGVIRCPYHSWCYDLNGALRTTPHVGGPGQNTHDCVKRDELGLLEVRSHVFMDMIWVNMSGDAPDFETYTATLRERWSEYVDRPLWHGGELSSFSLDVKTNWKLAVENYCESYHLPWVHPGLNSYSRLEDHYNIVEPEMFSGQGTLVYNPRLDDSGREFSVFGGLDAKWDTMAEYIALYPNVLLGVHKDHTFSILLDPVAQDRTIERVEIYYASEDMLGEEWRDLREKHAALWKEVFEEDVFVVEGMHRGRSASKFDGGKFSPVMDNATHCFHDWIARRFSLPA
jgi:phenylpropionate dioxygenase-like ring-hydroxylating dioxygenase large terminal subunit